MSGNACSAFTESAIFCAAGVGAAFVGAGADGCAPVFCAAGTEAVVSGAVADGPLAIAGPLGVCAMGDAPGVYVPANAGSDADAGPAGVHVSAPLASTDTTPCGVAIILFAGIASAAYPKVFVHGDWTIALSKAEAPLAKAASLTAAVVGRILWTLTISLTADRAAACEASPTNTVPDTSNA